MGDRVDSLPSPTFPPSLPPQEGVRVEHWLRVLQAMGSADLERCIVTSADYCKATGGKGHEYVCFQVQDRDTHAIFSIMADRRWIPGADSTTTPPNPPRIICQRSANPLASASDLSVVSSSSSLHTALAYDTIRSTSSPPPKEEIVDRILFSNPKTPLSLLSLVYVLDAAHRAEDTYHIYKSNCYWYAHVVWDTLIKVFGATPSSPVSPTEAGRKRGTYCGCTAVVPRDVEAGVANTIENYETVCRAHTEKRDASKMEILAKVESLQAQLDQEREGRAKEREEREKERAELERKLLFFSSQQRNNSEP
ncbi:hypothetical protein JAAARDRAFT_32822 [Jaapia argillacea MUCL 33604]|uniref:Uncharacterized protein n=1 Tax=Jaapia argillacea MUCL 33604 TaxID=933084 RepID=A0A067Q0E9_9AGAM|nr:hypothetical protein JAAARDRAFT_32822 [Jaapia argillacea MUCL 33604]